MTVARTNQKHLTQAHLDTAREAAADPQSEVKDSTGI